MINPTLRIENEMERRENGIGFIRGEEEEVRGGWGEKGERGERGEVDGEDVDAEGRMEVRLVVEPLLGGVVHPPVDEDDDDVELGGESVTTPSRTP